jgi:hypothetical protein
MNGYNLIRDWYNYKFENPSRVKASHSDFYCYLIDRWNRLGQKNEFGLPTSVTMEALGIGSYNSYKKTLQDLIDFGFIKLVTESKNQYQSKVIALSKNDKASDKALDEAHNKAPDKATDTIYKQKNKRTNEDADAISIDKFILWFNDMKLKYKKVEGKFKTLSKTDLNNLKSLKTLGYTADDFEHAYKIMVDSIWTKENSTDTPTHFLRNDNFSKYVNTVVSNQSKLQPYG